MASERDALNGNSRRRAAVVHDEWMDHGHHHDVGIEHVEGGVARLLWVGAALCACLTLIGAVILWPGDDHNRALDPALLSEPISPGSQTTQRSSSTRSACRSTLVGSCWLAS